jgi:ERF superfamily
MTTRNVHQRIAAAMGAVSYVQKEKKKGMLYSIVSHDAVTALVRPALLEQGVIYYPIRTTPSYDGNRTEVQMTVRFANIDEPADFIDVESFGHGIDPGDKSPGKAMSYAVKYALLKTLGLETGDDPDLDQDVKHEQRKTADTAGDESVNSYVTATLAAFKTFETAAALKGFWLGQRQADLRAALDIVNGTKAYETLFNAFAARGKALSVSTKIEAPAA